MEVTERKRRGPQENVRKIRLARGNYEDKKS